MSILWPVWEVFVNVVETVLFCTLLNKKLGYSKEKAGRVWGGMLAIIMNLSILNHSNIDYRLVMLLVLLLDILYALWAYEGDRGHRIFWGCSHTVIAAASNSVVLYIFSITHKDLNLEIVLSQTQIRFQMMALYVLALLIMYTSLYFMDSKKTVIPGRVQFLLLTILTTGTIASGLLINVNLHLAGWPKLNNEIVLISGMFLAIMIGIMFVFEYTGILNKNKLDLELALQQERLEKSHNEHMIEVYEAMRTWKHDYNNHLLVIKAYAQQGKYDDLLIYIGGLSEQFNQLTQFINTGNTAIDALVTNKLLITSKNNIPTNVSIQLPETLPISTLDFSALLANLLDNAIEACQRLSEKQKSNSYIDLRVEPKLGMLSLHITNSSDGVYNFSDKQLASRKKEGDHGLGLKRVKSIVKAANGFIEIKPGDNIFTVNILIPLNS